MVVKRVVIVFVVGLVGLPTVDILAIAGMHNAPDNFHDDGLIHLRGNYTAYKLTLTRADGRFRHLNLSVTVKLFAMRKVSRKRDSTKPLGPQRCAFRGRVRAASITLV
jgi:hypothetical protein